MSAFSKDTGFQPIITFISFTVLGVVVALYVNDNEKYKILYIFGGMLIGIIIAGIEFRALLLSSKQKKNSNRRYTLEEKKLRLAKQVAELFDEDIPDNYFELENEK